MRSMFRDALIGVMTVAVGFVIGSATANAQASSACPTNLPVISSGKLTMSINASTPPNQFKIDAWTEWKGKFTSYYTP